MSSWVTVLLPLPDYPTMAVTLPFGNVIEISSRIRVEDLPNVSESCMIILSSVLEFCSALEGEESDILSTF